MNYTIRLTHGQAFMIGVYDSAGNSFAFGPLHAGDSNNLGCLQVATGQTMPDVAILFLRRKPRPRLGKLHSVSRRILRSWSQAGNRR
jgi:hypothetical protein